MKTDRELLELAAKAAGYREAGINKPYTDGLLENWNPLESDGDALRLAVKLGMVVGHHTGLVFVGYDGCEEVEPHNGDPYAHPPRHHPRCCCYWGGDEMKPDRIDYYIDLINEAQAEYVTCFIDGYQYRERIAAILVSVAAEAATTETA